MSLELNVGDRVRRWNNEKDYYVVRIKRGNGPDKDMIYVSEDGKFEEFQCTPDCVKTPSSKNSETPDYKVGDIVVYFKYKTEKIGRIKSIHGTYFLLDDYEFYDYYDEDHPNDGIDIKNIYRLATVRECEWFKNRWNYGIDNSIEYLTIEIDSINKKIQALLKNKMS
ncbi:MAG: hypothetical protein ACRC1D_00700 [Culicoidibacterales bacterium]